MSNKQDFSEENIRVNCPHCDTSSQAFEYPLEPLDQIEDFYLLCDSNNIVEGHTLIIPKEHLAGIGKFSPALLENFKVVHEHMRDFMLKQYGSIAIFEHGTFGQTVFHSHIHYLPFEGTPEDIVPEGLDKLRPLAQLEDLKDIFDRDGGYLFLAIGDMMWTVDPVLSAPRFFRDRFAEALNVPERGNWKAMREDPDMMKSVDEMSRKTQAKWQRYSESA
jgi:diadenosine tetraphosphate (Ap4A) HIT family hydrolase